MSNQMRAQQNPIEGLILNNPDLSVANECLEDTWKGDCLKRASFAQELERIVSVQDEALTIALNGTWGTGKTFFLTRLAKQYKCNGGTVVFLNVWEDDELIDPFVPIVSSLWYVLKDAYQDFKKSFIESVGKILNHSITSVLSRCADKFPITSVIKGVANDVLGDSESVGDRIVEDYIAQTANKREFKTQLADIAQKNFDKIGRPILFIIDELDRCRPTYSIQVLERVKHLFGVPHFVFLFGIDRTQLEKTIKNVYGSIDVNDYLHRFFDVELNLPVLSADEFIDSNIQQYYSRVCSNETDARNNSMIFCNGELIGILKGLAKICQLTLREIQIVFRCILMSRHYRQHNALQNAILVTFVSVLKIRFPSILNKLMARDTNLNEILDPIFGDKIENAQDYTFQSLISLLYNLYSDNEKLPQQTLFIKELSEKLRERQLVNTGSFYDPVEGFDYKRDFVAKCVQNEPELLNCLYGVGSSYKYYFSNDLIDNVFASISCLSESMMKK